MTRLLVWDPGLDVAGWAAFDPSALAHGQTIEDRVGPALVAHGAIRSSPEEPLGVRLDSLVHQAIEVAHRTGPARWIIEQPAHVAVYGRHTGKGKAMHDSLLLCAHAAGAIAAVARIVGDPAPEFVRASRTPKELKQRLARAILAVSRCADRSNSDTRDAIALGARMLLERRAA